jgi:chemotaxis protein CheD
MSPAVPPGSNVGLNTIPDKSGGRPAAAVASAGVARHFLLPGELFTGREAAMVGTLLGSCVAVTMFSPRCRVGAVSHSMLPSCRSDQPCGGQCADGPRYVECSINRMLSWFIGQGILHAEIEVKVFGGSEMFAGSSEENKRPGVGRQNIDMALQVLERDGLSPVVSDLGGRRGRKIFFKTDTGEVFVKRLGRLAPSP